MIRDLLSRSERSVLTSWHQHHQVQLKRSLPDVKRAGNFKQTKSKSCFYMFIICECLYIIFIYIMYYYTPLVLLCSYQFYRFPIDCLSIAYCMPIDCHGPGPDPCPAPRPVRDRRGVWGRGGPQRGPGPQRTQHLQGGQSQK